MLNTEYPFCAARVLWLVCYSMRLALCLRNRSVAEEVLGEYSAPHEGLLTEMHKIKSSDLLELQEEGAVRK